MKSQTYPLALPSDLFKEIRKTAKRPTGYPWLADTMRQSIKLGAPKLREQLAPADLKPFIKEEARRAYSLPNEEFDELEHHCARLPKPLPEAD